MCHTQSATWARHRHIIRYSSSESDPQQRRREKSQGQENKIIIVSKQPQEKNNIRGMSHKGATLATHRKTPCQVLKVGYNYEWPERGFWWFTSIQNSSQTPTPPPLSYFAKLVSEGDKKDVFILIL